MRESGARLSLGVQRTDYIERMIAQLAYAVAQALGIAASGDVQRAKEDLRATWSSFVGVQRADLDRVDTATALVLLGDRRELAMRLLEAEARLGDETAARLMLRLTEVSDRRSSSG